MAARFFFKNTARSVQNLDSSAEIIEDTPESSPSYVRQPTVRQAHASEPDSGISDSGTRSKSVSPEDQHHYRSPQVILDSEDEDRELSISKIASPDVSSISSDSSFRGVPVKRFNRIIDSDVEEEDEDQENTSSTAEDREEGREDIEVEEEDEDEDEYIKTVGGKPRQYVIGSDDSDEEDDISEEEEEQEEDNIKNVSDRIKSVGVDSPDSSLNITPAPVTSDDDADSDDNLPLVRPRYIDPKPGTSEKKQPSPPAGKRCENKGPQGDSSKDVIDVSSDEEDICIVGSTEKPRASPSPATYSKEDLTELETQIRKIGQSIASNEYICNSRGKSLPDGGAGLRQTIRSDKARLMQLRETLGKARLQLARSMSGVTLPGLPKSTSASSLQSPPLVDAYMAPVQPRITKTLSGSSLLAPIDNLPPTTQLERARKKQSELQNGLKYAQFLPDGGEKARENLATVEREIARLEEEVKSGTAAAAAATKNQAWFSLKQNFQELSADDMAKYLAGSAASNPLYGGRMTASRQREVKAVTAEAMERIHRDLETIPAEGDEEEQPLGLKSSIQLFPHQRQALAWMLWRETRHPPGGILADDMGLGKTLEMVSLILKHRELETEREKNEGADKENSGTSSKWMEKGAGNLINTRTTLIICPASLMGQWEGEINSKVKSGRLSVLVYHGQSNRKVTARELSRYDVIITTYGVILSEVKAELGDNLVPKKMEDVGRAEDLTTAKHSKLLSLAFERIILDEAHTIRNPKGLQSIAVTKLRAVRRWCVTGTPIQNKELDMYSLVRFLRLDPFDEYMTWKRWVENKSAQAAERMNLLIKFLLLRRTKEQKSLTTGKTLVDLPDKHIEVHNIQLTPEEMEVYNKVQSRSKAAMERFVDQHKDRNEMREMGLGYGGGGGKKSSAPSNEFAFNPNASRGDNDEGEVKAHQLLVLLLRMRQLCCHPSLIKGMLDQETRNLEGLEDEAGEDLDLISQLEDMNIGKDSPEAETVEKKILDLSNPVFSEKAPSSKIKKVISHIRKLKEKELRDGEMEKAVVISQWTGMLNIVKIHLKREGLECTEINGQVNIKDRADIVRRFNRPNQGPQVMLLSLAAGGVGLNLVGANHLFLLDMHWNPQMESQAMDRIYRVGQKKDVKMHKFVVKGSVEEGILALQEKKLKLSEDVLSGAKKRGGNTLSLDELKFLFGVSM